MKRKEDIYGYRYEDFANEADLLEEEDDLLLEEEPVAYDYWE